MFPHHSFMILLSCSILLYALLPRFLAAAESTSTNQCSDQVGSILIFEDEMVRVWNFTLKPGETTTTHRHNYDYHFVAIQPTQLEVYSENGTRLFDFRAEGTLGFKVDGEFLTPTNIQLPWPVPRTHSAKNIGTTDYYEILVERKV